MRAEKISTTGYLGCSERIEDDQAGVPIVTDSVGA